MAVGAYSSSTSVASYVVSGQVGIDITVTHSSASGPKHALGQIVHTARGQRFQYARAMSTVNQYDTVIFAVTGSATTVFQTNVQPATIVLSSTFSKIAVAPVAIASGAYGWVQTGGGAASLNLAAACQPLVPLFFTATAGVLDDAVTSQCCALGIKALSSSSAGGASVVQCALADALTVGWNGGL